jgi:N-dimethylarginine dimethylaminohydrolase
VGAKALGCFFEQRGWKVIYVLIDPELLHLDTHFCMLDSTLALGCIEKLEPAFLEQVARLGIEVVPVEQAEVSSLGCNILSLGGQRIISTGSAPRVDAALRSLGFEVRTVALDEFTQCGGGVHCLTMPLRRSAQ